MTDKERRESRVNIVESVPAMIFPKPLFPFVIEPRLKTPRISIEGKYTAIKKHIKSLVKQGWEVVTITGEPDFKMTRVELESKHT